MKVLSMLGGTKEGGLFMNTITFWTSVIYYCTIIFWILAFYCMFLFIRFAREQHKEYIKRNMTDSNES